MLHRAWCGVSAASAVVTAFGALTIAALPGCGSSAGSQPESASNGNEGGSGAAEAGDSNGGTQNHGGSAQNSGGSAVTAGGISSNGGADATAGSSAGGGSSVARSCEASVMNGVVPAPTYDVVNTSTGLNGTFADECDADGNLIEYVCEYVPPTPKDGGRYTGNVVPVMVSCLGNCQGGACYVSKSCPKPGDEVTWVSAGPGSAVLDNPRAQVRYTCTLRVSPYGFDCYDPALAGTKAKVNSAGPCGTFTHVSVDTAANGEGTTDCAYECSETPL